MLQKVEVVLSSRNYHDDDEIKSILGMIVSHNMRGLSTFGYYLDTISGFGELPNIYVNIDCPFGQNNTYGRLALAAQYHRDYGEIIKGFNFGCLPQQIYMSKWDDLSVDCNALADFCKEENIESRFLMDLSCNTDFDKIHKALNIVEESGMGTLITGYSSRNGMTVEDSIIDIHKYTKNCSMDKGIMLRNCKEKHLSSLNNHTFCPILLSANNILRFLE